MRHKEMESEKENGVAYLHSFRNKTHKYTIYIIICSLLTASFSQPFFQYWREIERETLFLSTTNNDLLVLLSTPLGNSLLLLLPWFLHLSLANY